MRRAGRGRSDQPQDACTAGSSSTTRARSRMSPRPRESTWIATVKPASGSHRTPSPRGMEAPRGPASPAPSRGASAAMLRSSSMVFTIARPPSGRRLASRRSRRSLNQGAARSAWGGARRRGCPAPAASRGARSRARGCGRRRTPWSSGGPRRRGRSIPGAPLRRRAGGRGTRAWRVGDAGEDHLGAVVGDDGGRAVAAVDGVDLGHVLEDGDELDPLSGAGRGERGELAQGCDVGALVEDEQQRRIERLPVSVRGRRRDDDLLDERCEERLQAALLVSGSAEVGGVAAAVEEALGAELGAHGRGQHAGVGVRD